MPALTPRFIASNTIQPSTIVKADTAANFHVLPAAASSDKPVGIAQEGSYYAPGVLGAPTYAATTGQPITVYGEGEECLLTLGTGGCTAGDYLKSDSSGNGVTVTFTAGTGLVWSIGEALETAAVGEKVRVLVRILAIGDITA